jgi:hypothetical protein
MPIMLISEVNPVFCHLKTICRQSWASVIVVCRLNLSDCGTKQRKHSCPQLSPCISCFTVTCVTPGLREAFPADPPFRHCGNLSSLTQLSHRRSGWALIRSAKPQIMQGKMAADDEIERAPEAILCRFSRPISSNIPVQPGKGNMPIIWTGKLRRDNY